MKVYETVEQHRRRKRRRLATVLLLSLGALAAAFVWWLARPGRPVQRALGVSVPEGSRQLHDERATADADASFDAVYLSSTLSVAEATARFSSIAAEANDETRRYVLPDGTEVVVAPPHEIPATRLSPIHPVADEVPLGTRSWIVISRGTPPASTWTVSVPPLGES
ncbi:MAG TPA: hypothetical protein RMH99_28170 [Sandaracinaceae bacterium LLY-WYZ-13_1]|nr:hypothetical protein [Sandaracinaceae bacterium LLY-WYZ-13_1]